MKFKRWIVSTVAMCLLLSGTVITSTACRHTPPTITTASGQVAFQMEDVVDVVNALQHEAIALSHAGRLPRATALKVVTYRRSAVTVIDKAIDAGTGKDAALTDVDNGLQELEKQLAAPEQALLRTAIGSVRTVLAALKGQ
jgi:hypothetical protein